MKLRINTYISGGKGSHTPASIVGAFEARARLLRKGMTDAQNAAARAAQQRSMSTQKRLRPKVGPRAGRDYRSIRSSIEWRPTTGTGVALNVSKLDHEAPHWIIHEIGTGNSANVRTGGTALAKGRPRNTGPNRRTVSSQVGRRISRRLVWADQGGNFAQYTPGKHQLALASQVSGVPFHRRSMVIKREIKPQHFIREGAKEGFRVYRRSVLSAARQSLTKKR